MISEYWDTCLFIAYLKNSPDEKSAAEAVDALIRTAQQPEKERLIVVSTLALAELRSRSDYIQSRYHIVQDIFYTNRPYVRVVTLTPRIAHLASSIGSENPRLSPADAVHIATAISERVDALLTLDGLHEHGIRRRNDLLFYDGKIGSPPLAIKPPAIPPGTQLIMSDRT